MQAYWSQVQSQARYVMQLELIGPHPFALDEQGRQITRIGTLFPSYGVLWTQPPCVHALQRLGFIERVNAERASKSRRRSAWRKKRSFQPSRWT